MVVFVQTLAAVLCLVSAAQVGAVAGGLVGWPAAAEPGPGVRQAVAERGPAIAIALTMLGAVWLVVAGQLRRGRRWSRVVVLMVSAVGFALTSYGAYRRGAQVDTSWFRGTFPAGAVAGLMVSTLVVIALCTRAARSWFRWGDY
ncbi:MAG: hypothetical protein J2P15_00750 [Micromonosporaceae bacterium]|nr:hypothetical protein [Micromonosporaceae bacterium]